MVTDGDIRRFLIKNSDMTSPVKSCMNESFIYATVDATREYVLKLLDHRVQVVPILSKEGMLEQETVGTGKYTKFCGQTHDVSAGGED